MAAELLGLDALLAAVGYALLAPLLRGRRAHVWPSYLGVSFLAGAGAVGVVVGILAVLGLPESKSVGLSVMVVLAAGGCVLATLAPRREAGPTGRSRVGVGTALSAPVAVGALFTVGLATFRSAPWLDDTYTMWVPKALALQHVGLDAHIFAPSTQYMSFQALDYPLWWPTMLGLVSQYTGIDFNAYNAQLGLLSVAFVAAVVRLLWGRVHPFLLMASVLLLVSASEFQRQLQSGAADVPLALYVSLSALSAVVWLVWQDRVALAVAFVAAVTAAQIKLDALPELVIVFVVVGALGSRRFGRRAWWLAALPVAALLFDVPWLAWRAMHHVPSSITLRQALDPRVLFDQREQGRAALHVLSSNIFDIDQWSWIVGVLAAVCVLGFLLRPSLLWGAPLLVVASAFGLVLWTEWIDPIPLRLYWSGYRIIDPVVLLAWVSIPVVAEAVLQTASRAAWWSRRADKGPIEADTSATLLPR